MAKITEAGKQGEGSGKYFSSKDIVGIPFEIIEDVNLYGDQIREFVPKDKEGKPKMKEGRALSWLAIGVKCNGEEKDLHVTNSALRAIRDVLPKGQMTAKGERLVMNQDAKGFNPAKFTRLMGDYGKEMPREQQQIGQPIPQGLKPQLDPILIQVFDKLKYGSQFFTAGLIPTQNVVEACVTPANFQTLKDKGLIIEPVPGFYRLVML